MSAAARQPQLPNESLLRLERKATRFFCCGIDAAIEATWEEATRLGLGKLMVEDFMVMVQRVLREEMMRLGME